MSLHNYIIIFLHFSPFFFVKPLIILTSKILIWTENLSNSKPGALKFSSQNVLGWFLRVYIFNSIKK